MKNCKSINTTTKFGLKLNKERERKKIVGSLKYLHATTPNILYSVSLISRCMESPTENHLLIVKRIRCYLKGTKGPEISTRKVQS